MRRDDAFERESAFALYLPYGFKEVLINLFGIGGDSDPITVPVYESHSIEVTVFAGAVLIGRTFPVQCSQIPIG